MEESMSKRGKVSTAPRGLSRWEHRTVVAEHPFLLKKHSLRTHFALTLC